MNQTKQTATADPAGPAGSGSPIAAAVIFAVVLLLGPAILLLAAGTLAWSAAWAYIAIILLGALGSRWAAWRQDPSVLRERANFTRAEQAVPGDRMLVLVSGVVGPLVAMVVAGLDHRFGWSNPPSVTLQSAAIILIALMAGVSTWAMATNPFFSAVARLQTDRGQTVVQSGPYRWVRHPSYASALLYSLALPLALGSAWILLPTAFIVAAIIVRTHREDHMLLAGLPGYDAYARRTRFRLFPGVW